MDNKSVNKFKVIPIKGKAHGGMNSTSAESVSTYMLGKNIANYTITKNGDKVENLPSDVTLLKNHLNLA